MSDIVKAIAGATEKDLDAIEKEIATVQGEITKLENKISSLKSARRLIDFAINGNPLRKPRQKKEKTASTVVVEKPTKQVASEMRDALEDRIYELISDRGPLTGMQIVKMFQVPMELVKAALESSSRMRVKPGGVVVLTD